VLLTGETAQNLCPHSRMVNHFGTHLPKLWRAFARAAAFRIRRTDLSSRSAWTMSGVVYTTSSSFWGGNWGQT